MLFRPPARLRPAAPEGNQVGEELQALRRQELPHGLEGAGQRGAGGSCRLMNECEDPEPQQKRNRLDEENPVVGGQSASPPCHEFLQQDSGEHRRQCRRNRGGGQVQAHGGHVRFGRNKVQQEIEAAHEK